MALGLPRMARDCTRMFPGCTRGYHRVTQDGKRMYLGWLKDCTRLPRMVSEFAEDADRMAQGLPRIAFDATQDGPRM